MSEWRIRIPYRSRSEPLAGVAAADRAVVRQIVLGELVGGSATTAGELIDKLQKSSPEQRRKMLDDAREKAGLPDTETVEARRKFEIASDAGRLTASNASPWQLCAAGGCTAMLFNELGAPTPVDVRSWWCAAHRNQAADGDMEPRPSGIRMSPSGALVEYDPDEEARAAAAEESRRRLHEDRLAERAVEAAARREHDEARAAAVRRELPPGVPG